VEVPPGLPSRHQDASQKGWYLDMAQSPIADPGASWSVDFS
jgi:hypothetical protein